MTERPTVLLFDVDGTLVRTGGAGTRALRAAFDRVHGAPDAASSVDVRGNTDGSIVASALEGLGIDPCAISVGRVLDAYLEALAGEVASSPAYQVLPGAETLLRELATSTSHALGLGTGNHVRGAGIKLARGGLARFFEFGGYGSDSHHRPTLIRIGAERGAERFRKPMEACRVVVLGDTPHDVSAARAIGADVIAVATGGHSIDDLRACEPTLAVESLEDPRVHALLTI